MICVPSVCMCIIYMGTQQFPKSNTGACCRVLYMIHCTTKKAVFDGRKMPVK